MTSINRRLSAAACALVIGLSFAAEPAFAQATNGPSAGVGSTTAPSNSEGTPAGGTGTVANTRVAPSGQTASTHRSRRRARRARHPAAAPTTGTQSDSGLNGSAVPAR